MSLTLDQLKKAFKKPENEGGNLPNNYFPFWQMKDGEQATVRFLPDKNANNPLGFIVEKLMHNLDINGERKSVACLKMYEEDCPICKLSSEYYKKDDKVNGKKYWRQRQYLAQALIVEDPLPANETSGEKFTGKVRNLTLGYQIYNVIKEAFEGGDLDEVPYAYKGGTDFIIKKTKQGDYSTYAVGSRFRIGKSSDLTEEQLAVVNESLIDLATLLPKHPGLEKVEGMLAAAVASVGVAPVAKTAKASAPVDEDDNNVPTDAVATTTTSTTTTVDDGADDILKQIRARRAAAQS
jgi:hypothetical protein